MIYKSSENQFGVRKKKVDKIFQIFWIPLLEKIQDLTCLKQQWYLAQFQNNTIDQTFF